MPRANRYFIPGHVWHITHRCHQKEFLLKFVKDRQRWRYWLFEAKKRYRLCVLNYMVTSNHIHLLVHDQGKGEITQSMQLIAGRTAQEYNQRKGRKGAYWEDRYHATAVDTDEYLARCMVYIDLNMVRAGAVKHPRDWVSCGFREIQFPTERYTVIDKQMLMDLFGVSKFSDLQELHRGWIDEALALNNMQRDDAWTQSIAIGGRGFVSSIKESLGTKAQYRDITESIDKHVLKEPTTKYYRLRKQ
ncbi:MAG: transposase, partial [Gammaproteobacteria bacterium]|nr:transposase [Gammaproteobacteria bacterium]